MHNAISDGTDGHTRIFFQNPAPSSSSAGGGPLYMREDGATTVEVSAPATGYLPASTPTATGIRYLDAARDGSVVYFWANGDLTSGAPEAGGVYRYDTISRTLTWIGAAPDGGRTTGLADLDGSHFYYQGAAGLNLYANGSNRLIAPGASVAAAGSVGTPGSEAFPGPTIGVGIRGTHCVSATVSPDGRYFVFDDGNRAIYRYDANGDGGSGELTKLVGEVPGGVGFRATCAASAGRNVDIRVMSDDGRFVFFSTPAPLVPQDTNNRIDVYRWQASDNSVKLISTGIGTERSIFVGADPVGDVFFTTQDALVPGDGDAASDLYVAKIGGGFLVPTVPPPCLGDQCQGPVPPAPLSPQVGSSLFAGPGNPQAKHKQGRHARRGRRGRKKSRHARGRKARAKTGGSKLRANDVRHRRSAK